MKKQDDALYLMQLNEVRAFASKLARANEVTAGRCQSAASPWNIKPVEARELECGVKKLVGLLL